MMSSSPSIHIKSLSKRYRHQEVFANLEDQFLPGKLHLLTGPNGCGKSTYLKCMMGIVSYEGRVEIQAKRIGYAPEKYILPEFATFVEFLGCLGRIKGLEKAQTKEALQKWTSLLGLEPFHHTPMARLSKGTQQKINLMQALIHEPEIILLDEPFDGLDQETMSTLLAELIREAKDRVIIITTHQPESFSGRKKQIHAMKKDKGLDV